MPTKHIGELNIAMDLTLCPEDLSATFVGKDLPQVIRLREKYTPWLAEYGLNMHGFPFVLGSKWNSHVDSVGFLVGVDTAAQVDFFVEAEFKSWLSKKYKLAVKEVLSGSLVSLIGENYSEGNVSTTESGPSNSAEQIGMVGPGGDSQQEVSPHHQSLADSVVVNQDENIGGKHPGNSLQNEGVASEGSHQESSSLDLTEKQINQLNRLIKGNQVPERTERTDIIECIALGILHKKDNDRILVEGPDLAERIKLDEPFEGLEFTRTDEIAVRVKTIWPSPDAMIALALPSEAAETSREYLNSVPDEED